MNEGTIKNFYVQKGYGFIEWSGNRDLFFHVSAWHGQGNPQIGQRVSFVEGIGKPGKPSAQSVLPLGTVAVKKVTQSQPMPRSRINNAGEFHNPYNFVRLISGKPTLAEKKNRLLDRCPPPSHDRWIGLSGKITAYIEAKTPLFISSAEDVSSDDKEHNSYRFFTVNGRKAIPSSSLRGVLRSTYEAVTNSCFANLADTRLSYRTLAADASKLVPGRVVKQDDDGKWHVQLLTGTTPLKFDQQLSKYDKQYAAWIHQYWPVEPSKTLVKPMHEIQASQKLKKDIQHLRDRTPKNDLVDLQGLKHGEKCFALIKETQHPFPSISFWDVVQVSGNKDSLDRAQKQGKGDRVVDGWLCLTNQNTERKHSERLFFCASKIQTLLLNEDVCRDYELLMHEYHERHAKDVKKWRDNSRNPDLAQPQNKVEKEEIAFSRFVSHMESKLKSGTLVYVKLKGESSKPEVDFMVPVTVSRVLYERSIEDLLPNEKAHRCESYDALCPACRLFGWVHGKQGQEAYRGRVRFSHALLVEGNEGAPENPLRLQILSSPKPTTTLFYLIDKDGTTRNGRSQESAGYNNTDNCLRGRKFYRHYLPAKEKIILTNEQQNKDKNWDQNRTILDPVGEGTKFKFELIFENLAEVELGALLWSLTLDNEAFHKIGYGKPLGLGSVDIQINDDGIVLDDMVHRYETLQAANSTTLLANGPRLIKLFKEQMELVWQRPFNKLEPVTDIKVILDKNGSDLPVHYPYSPANDSKGNFEWFVGNSSDKGPKLALPLAIETKGLPLMDKKGK